MNFMSSQISYKANKTA